MKTYIIVIVCIIILFFLLRNIISPKMTFKLKKKRMPVKEKEINDSTRLIFVKRMDEEEIRKAINDFIELYKENNIDYSYLASIPCREENDELIFELPSLVKFNDFALIINYLIYSDNNKRHNNDIKGIYPSGTIKTKRASIKLSNQDIKFFIPEDDEKYDEVYLENNDKNQFIMSFTDFNIKPKNN